MKEIATTQQVEDEVKSIISRTSNVKFAERLKKVHETLHKLHARLEKHQPISISLLVSHLNLNHVSISERTIYNHRVGGNLYREIYDVWYEFRSGGALKIGKEDARNSRIEPLSLLDVNELDCIQNETLKYRIKMSLSLLRNTMNQLDILKKTMVDESKLNPIHGSNNFSASISKQLLNQNELEVISNFLRRTDTSFNEVGAITAARAIRGGTVLSRPGLFQALKKVCNQ